VKEKRRVPPPPNIADVINTQEETGALIKTKKPNIFSKFFKPKKVNDTSKNKITHGVLRLVDYIANSVDRSNSEYFRIGNNYVKTMLVTGYPKGVEIGWLNAFLEHPGDIDFAIHVKPYQDRASLDELTEIATRLETEADFSRKSGDLSLVQEINTALTDAWGIRNLVATNRSRFYNVTTLANLYNPDLKELETDCALLEQKMSNRSIYTKMAEGRMDEGFLSTTPMGINLCGDVSHGFDSFALSTIFLFQVADLKHRFGVPFAINVHTGKFLNYTPFDPSLDNHNGAIFAGSGKGKSTLIKTLGGRIQFAGVGKRYNGVRMATVDPMGEFVTMVDALGGVNVDLGPGAESSLNPCDIAPEYVRETGEWVVNIGNKISSMTILTSIMCGELTAEEESLCDEAWKNVYMGDPFNFTEDPESLYEEMRTVDNIGNATYGKVKKKMPRLRDFHAEISQMGEKMGRLTTIMKRFLHTNPSMGFFDQWTNVELDSRTHYNFVTKRLDAAARVPGMFLALAWIEENFVKKDPDEPGLVVIDEAWLFTRSKAAPITMSFLELLYRTSRHFNKGIFILSQDFQIFTRHEQGMSIFQNSDTMFFLANSDAECEALQAAFSFSESVLKQIRESARGEGIMKVKDKYFGFKVEPTQLEENWVYSSKQHLDEEAVEEVGDFAKYN